MARRVEQAVGSRERLSPELCPYMKYTNKYILAPIEIVAVGIQVVHQKL